MRALAIALLLLGAGVVVAGDATGVRIVEDTGRWESGYGVEFYNVVGKLEVTDGTPRRFVRLRVEALDEAGKVVATETAYNETAEALSAPGADAGALIAAGKVTPVVPGKPQRFRTSFLKDEHPTVARHRVTVAEAPAAEQP
jgi:hypothetical protein